MEQYGLAIAQMAVEIAALGLALRWIAGRVDRIENKLENGIQVEITKMKVSIARIEEQFKALALSRIDNDRS